MRASFQFIALVAAAMLAGAVLAYPLHQLVSGAHDFGFDSIAHRIFELVLIVFVVIWSRRETLWTKKDYGYGLPWRRFVAVACWAGVVGIATAALGAWFLAAAGLRIPRPEFVLSVQSALKLLATGLGSGLAVPLLEDTFMRGIVHSAIEKDSGAWTAAVVTALVFALLHVLGTGHIAPNEVSWTSGFELIGRSFAAVVQPAGVFDSFAAWTVAFLILSMTRVLTGNIAVAAGLHGGWVVVLRILRDTTQTGRAGPYSGWVGHLDGVIGYWMLPWGAALALGLWLTRRAWAPAASIEAMSAV